MKDLYIFPSTLNNGKWSKEGNQHLQKIAKEIKKSKLYNPVFITADELKLNINIKNNNIILLNWMDTLYLSYLNRYICSLIQFLPLNIIKYISKKIVLKIIILIRKYKKEYNIKIVFYFHDLVCMSRFRVIQECDKLFKSYIIELADKIIFAENSAKKEVEVQYGKVNKYGISQLGGYKDFHGEVIDSNEARRILKIPNSKRVVFLLGTKRGVRDNLEILEQIRVIKDIYLLVCGPGNSNAFGDGFQSFGFVSNNDLIRMISASDYIINPGKNYLTSAALRLALSYHRPCIAYNYGSTIDMCKDALISLSDSFEENRETIQSLPYRNSPKYMELVDKCKSRDSERTWELAASNLIKEFIFD